MKRGRKRIGALSGSSQRRFSDHPGIGRPWTLDETHPAARQGHTLYRKRVTEVDGYHVVLKDGHNNRKIGRRITKGRWAGMNIYTLTLEERATCPRSCVHWLDCFGNKMNWSPRFVAGAELEDALDLELRMLARQHPDGFVVRLHVLGDFYSLEYVARWIQWLVDIPQLHVYGYTAHSPTSVIGGALLQMATHHWDRFAMRFSNSGLPEMATVSAYDVTIRGKIDLGIVCPAQTEETECCATCAFCWQSKDNVVFIGH